MVHPSENWENKSRSIQISVDTIDFFFPDDFFFLGVTPSPAVGSTVVVPSLAVVVGSFESGVFFFFFFFFSPEVDFSFFSGGGAVPISMSPGLGRLSRLGDDGCSIGRLIVPAGFGDFGVGPDRPAAPLLLLGLTGGVRRTTAGIERERLVGGGDSRR